MGENRDGVSCRLLRQCGSEPWAEQIKSELVVERRSEVRLHYGANEVARIDIELNRRYYHEYSRKSTLNFAGTHREDTTKVQYLLMNFESIRSSICPVVWVGAGQHVTYVSRNCAIRRSERDLIG